MLDAEAACEALIYTGKSDVKLSPDEWITMTLNTVACAGILGGMLSHLQEQVMDGSP